MEPDSGVTSLISDDDFAVVQEQLLAERRRHYELQQEIERRRRRSSMSAAQVAEEISAENMQMRKQLQSLQESEASLNNQLRLAKVMELLGSPDADFDAGMLPLESQALGREYVQVLAQVREQTRQRQLQKASVDELSRRSKGLSRASEQLHEELGKLRKTQADERDLVAGARVRLAALEEEVGGLRQRAQRLSGARERELVARMASVTTELGLVEGRRRASREELEGQVREVERHIEDLEGSGGVAKQKMEQLVVALQQEINRRRGIVVVGTGCESPDALFAGRKLLERLVEAQQEQWEAEDRVAFLRASVRALSEELARKLTSGGNVVAKQREEMQRIAAGLILEQVLGS